MAGFETPKSYRNWELLWTPNLIYDEFVNFDVVDLPYSKKKGNTGYALEKRKWYVVDQSSSYNWEDYWLTRDIVRVNKSNCVNENYDYYMYQTSQDRLKYRVIQKTQGNRCGVETIDEWFRCFCTYDRFFEFPFVSWTKRNLVWSAQVSTWDVSETRGTRIYDDAVDLSQIQIGDYLLIVNSSTPQWDFLVWQVRQVVGKGIVDQLEDESWRNQYIQLDPPFTNRPVDSDEEKIEFINWLEYSVYSDFKMTYWYATASGISTVESWTDVGSLWFGISGQSCLTSVQVLNGSVNYLNDRWFNFYGDQGLDVLHFPSDNTNEFWVDTLSTFAYKNFLLWFSYDSVSYAARTETGQNLIPLSADVGVKSKYSYGLVDNNLVMVTRDNRFVSVGLKWDWSALYLETQDISDYIRWHLDNMLKTDEVFIHEWNNNIYLFINTKQYHTNTQNDMTKILIFNKDYKLWHTHELCDMVLSWVKFWYFYGDGFYGYMGDEDIVIRPYQAERMVIRPIQSRIKAYIWQQEADQTQDSEGNSYRLIRRKSLNRMKFLLWRGIYTDGNTIIKITTYRNWYKYDKVFDTVEGVEWIDNWNNYFRGEEVSPSDCFIEDIDKCDNINRPCEWAYYNDTDPKEFEDDLICTNDIEIKQEIKVNDFCVCYDSRAYALSPFYNVYLYPLTKPADLHEITIYSNGYDKISFMWMIAEFTTEPIDWAMEWENVMGLECQKDTKTCPVDWCGIE